MLAESGLADSDAARAPDEDGPPKYDDVDIIRPQQLTAGENDVSTLACTYAPTPARRSMGVTAHLTHMPNPKTINISQRVPRVQESASEEMASDPFFNTEDASGYLGVPKATLLTWRVRRPGYGPRAVKAGGRLKYRLSELDRWLRAHQESFPEDEDIDNEPPPQPQTSVRNRRRTSRVRGAALRATSPDEVA
ncbi:helix-turn-helix domain-containing protein [Nocardioides sp. NPDC006303]|uniref:helix-turn-helix transcriptional regulator n=1 Tax=Nocardioides sp. NPDC006303 TaxID=3156747 RepID=UPI0033AE5DFD